MLSEERRREILEMLQTEGRGPLTSNYAEAGGFFRTRDGLEAPDVQFHAMPVITRGQGLEPPTAHAFSFSPCVLKPTSRGNSQDDPPSTDRPRRAKISDRRAVDETMGSGARRVRMRGRAVAAHAPMVALGEVEGSAVPVLVSIAIGTSMAMVLTL